MTLLFGLFQGIIIGPIVNEAIDVDPNIVRHAFVLTLCVFLSFSMIAMMTKNKKYLYLGGLLNSFCLFLFYEYISNIAWISIKFIWRINNIYWLCIL